MQACLQDVTFVRFLFFLTFKEERTIIIFVFVLVLLVKSTHRRVVGVLKLWYVEGYLIYVLWENCIQFLLVFEISADEIITFLS